MGGSGKGDDEFYQKRKKTFPGPRQPRRCLAVCVVEGGRVRAAPRGAEGRSNGPSVRQQPCTTGKAAQGKPSTGRWQRDPTRRAALLRLAVQCAAGGHKVRHVGDVHAHPVAPAGQLLHCSRRQGGREPGGWAAGQASRELVGWAAANGRRATRGSRTRARARAVHALTLPRRWLGCGHAGAPESASSRSRAVGGSMLKMRVCLRVGGAGQIKRK